MDNESSPSIEVTVESNLWHSIVAKPEKFCTGILQNFVRATLGSRCLTPVVSVLLTSDSSIRALNKMHRKIDKPTNVLSFPICESDEFDAALTSDAGPLMLGDIVLAAEIIAREAAGQRKSAQDHTAHLLVHGALHLLGYDHVEPTDAEQMERLEQDGLRVMGFADPYGDGAAV